MTTYYKTVITQIGPDVADLIEGGMLILFAEGSPPELAEVSVLHRVAEEPTEGPPAVGADLMIGELRSKLTAIGTLAWNKITDMGHVVVNFDGATTSSRPGELNASSVEASDLFAALKPGAMIVIAE